MNAKHVSKKIRSSMMNNPNVGRPNIPAEYGIPKDNKGLLP